MIFHYGGMQKHSTFIKQNMKDLLRDHRDFFAQSASKLIVAKNMSSGRKLALQVMGLISLNRAKK